MFLIFYFSHFECPIKVNDLVNELSILVPIFQLNSVPEFEVSMEYSKFLQFKDPIYQARNPDEYLSLSRLFEILDIVLIGTVFSPKDKLFSSFFQSQYKTCIS